MPTVKETANYFGVTPGTIRRRIREGCPCDRLGSIGRGHTSLLNFKDHEEWLAKKHIPTLARKNEDAILKAVEKAITDCVRTQNLKGQTLPVEQAFLILYERIFLNVKQTPMQERDLSPEMKRLRAIYLYSVERNF